MKAPDKIFLAFDGPYVAQSSNVKEDTNGNSVFLDEYTPIEYLRKDVLLEWAKEQLALCDNAVAMRRAYDKLINELNTL